MMHGSCDHERPGFFLAIELLGASNSHGPVTVLASLQVKKSGTIRSSDTLPITSHKASRTS